MGLYSVKPLFRRALEPLARASIRRRISPDALTIAGLLFAAAAGVGVVLGRNGGPWLVLIPVGALLRTMLNALDGMVATATGRARPLGEVLNETADRIGDVFVFLPLLWVAGVPRPLTAAVVSAILITSFLGVAVKAAGGPRVYAGVMAKPDRMLVMGVTAIVVLAGVDPDVGFAWALWMVLAGTVLTFAMRVRIARRELR